MGYRKKKTMSTDEVAAFRRTIKNDAKVTPQVAFAQFGRGETSFVVPSLTHLLNTITDVVALFAAEVP